MAAIALALAVLTGGTPTGQIVPTGAVDFDGANDYITFGPATGASGLNATDFTLELWFRREGAGGTTTSGTGGLTTVVPLVAKGRGEAEGSTVDMNYLLGLSVSGGVYTLAADFEQLGGTQPGLNHPVTSASSIAIDTWYHAAATYSSGTGIFTLYLNGTPVGSITIANAVDRFPRSDSIQHASIGSALTSTGVAAGFFNGLVDEVRIWNVARTQTEIAANMYAELTSGTGLIGRWGLNEGSGTTATNSIAGRPNGILTNGPLWVVPDLTPPAAPQGLSADVGNGLVTLSWNPNTDSDLAGYNVYRNGSATPLNNALLTSPIYTDATAANGQSYVYAVKAVDTSLNPSTGAEVVAQPSQYAGAGLQFNGSSQYVTFGPAAGTATGLGAATFTLETWFKRTGAGAATTTGTGGISDAIPLITKGMAEAESPANVNMNYFLGISAGTGRLVADFEDTATGLNHPITGTATIPVSTTTWHHAAATYDGTTWRLYLDGVLDNSLVVGAFTPESTSIQHAAIATALNSTGGVGSNPQGFFNGLLDEVRIWDYARTATDIQTSMNQEILSAPGLIGRWGLNEATGTTVASSTRPIPGNLVGVPRWTAGHPWPPDVAAPAAPTGLSATAGNAQVSLTWTANTEPDLAGYNVFRRTASTAFAAPLNAALLTSPAYLDATVVNETEYIYAVRAVDVFSNVSDLSAEAAATPSSNPPPFVSAGPDRVATLSSDASLSGSASDNGPFTVLWTKISGPGAVTFANAAAALTTATFSQTGVYVLRLTADDGQRTAFDEMSVTVTDPVLAGAGDIAADCTAGASTANAEATATLLDGIAGALFTLGDNAYVDGTATQFANCYGPTWGRHKARTRPVTGNHDYNSANATPYYDYFNGVGVQAGAAGDRTNGGYYSYNIGNWHVVVLNSECTSLWNPNGCAAGSPQEQWLRADLAASPTNNIIAMWHRPLYSSSSAASTHAYVQPLWQALYDYGVDIWLGGHWHNYERLAPINASGASDPTFGIRSFVVGTGGIDLTGFGTVLSTSQARNSTTHGVIKLTLHDTSYDWQFIPVAGSFTDSGTSVVHGPPSGNLPPVVDAGSDQTVPVGAAVLNGSVSDDGLVGPLTVTWSKLSGPGTVTFGNPNAVATSAGFSAVGVYALQLTANDGQLIRSDTTSVTVSAASGNLPPIVDAGANQTISLPGEAFLTGTVTDDGLPGSDVTTNWSKLSGPGTVTFNEPTSVVTSAGFSGAGTYVLRLTANDGELSGIDDVTVVVNPVQANMAVDFGGTNAYVTFGQAPGLGVSTFTIETWFRRDGAGVTTSTGTGGVVATPLVAKGRAESDGSNVDMNYFLGIDANGRLVADFEDTATGANHPAVGVASIPLSATDWHHAAATYDGTTWRLYLDGALDQTTAVGSFTPRLDSIQHASIGSALTSAAAAAGFFDGAIDEVRIWDRALSLSEIQANVNQQLPGAANLVARWGLNEGVGTAVTDSTAGPVNGVITGAGFAWTTGAPFNLTFNQPPSQPVLNAPANGATNQSTSPTLTVNVSDPDGSPMTVTFFGRPLAAAPVADFTLVALPDTQHYSDDATRAATFTAQTQWIVNNKVALNIPFVTHLGDIVENIDAVPVEWTRANTSMTVLDAGLVPYGLAPGNHDMNSAGVATNYDLTFPVSRMSGYPWYGGYLGQNLFNFTDPINRQNKNNFELFSAGGMDFIIIHLEYDMPSYAVAWANRVLAQYPNRRAIISTHLFLNASGVRPTTVLNRTTEGTPAATVWSQLIFPNCNVFLVLNGHYPGEANRTDPNACGQPVHQLASDYQSRANGGDGFLRYMTFKPTENRIYVYTYSPTLAGGLGQFETDANSQFVLDYNMQGVPFATIATNTNVASGTGTSTTWPGLLPNTSYAWYATVSDGVQTVTGSTWTFTTAAPPTYTLTYTAGANGTITGTSPQTVSQGGSGTTVTAVPNTGYHFVQWSDGVLTAARTDTNVQANLNVTASFAINTYTLTYTAGANGTITGTSPQTVSQGGSGTTVTAVPNTGYHFVQWSDGVLTAARTDTNVQANLSVTASFAINTYTLTYTAGVNGTITGTSPQTVSQGGSGSTVTAVPNTGYHFVQWSDGVPTAARTDTNVLANLSVTASFAINTYTLTYTAGPNGTITGTSPQLVSHGGSGTPVTAVPNTGYHFVQWSDGVLTAARTDTNVLANLSVTASFAINTYTLTYTAGPNGTITGTSPQTVAYGGNGLAVSAVPNSGYQFAQWSDGSTANPRTDSSVTADISVTAAFSLAGVSPTVLVQSPNGGEQLFSGSEYVITWTAQAGDRAIASFDVEYSTNNGGSYVPVPGCTGLGAASRQCTWAAPVTTATGRVRVTASDVAGLRGADASNASFTVVSGTASVMITGPTNGMTVLVGSVAPITWTHNVGTSTFAATFTIEISRNGTTGPWDVLAIGVPQASATTGRYDWTVVEPASTRVRFRVRPTNFTVVGTSGGNVTIASPSLALTAPLSGETWTISRKSTFRWTTTLGNTETVRVEISRDAGVTWNTVAAAVVASDGKFTWTVTGPATTQMRARVTWNRSGALSSASTGNNTIR